MFMFKMNILNIYMYSSFYYMLIIIIVWCISIIIIMMKKEGWFVRSRGPLNREKTVHLTNNTIHYGKYVNIVF